MTNKKYCDIYDVYYDADTNKWMEMACEDVTCEFCSKRPEQHCDDCVCKPKPKLKISGIFYGLE